jgi:hypothetical protein
MVFHIDPISLHQMLSSSVNAELALQSTDMQWTQITEVLRRCPVPSVHSTFESDSENTKREKEDENNEGLKT